MIKKVSIIALKIARVLLITWISTSRRRDGKCLCDLCDNKSCEKWTECVPIKLIDEVLNLIKSVD